MPDIRNIPLIFTVLALTVSCIIYILPIRQRVRGIRFVLMNLLFFLLSTVLLSITKNKDPRFTVFYLLAALILFGVYIKAAARITPISAAYCCVRAFMAGEFAAAAEWLLYVWFARKTGISSWAVQWIFMAVVYGVIFGVIYYLETLVQYDYSEMPVKPRDFIYTFAFAYACFYLGNSVRLPANAYAGISLAFYNTRTLMSFGSLAILYAFHALRREMYVKRELNTVQYIMQTQYEQYRQSKKNAELINVKYHDLKHQIEYLRQESRSEKGIHSLDRLEEEIRQYESETDTGNEVVDTVLTEKKRQCITRKIALTAVAEGRLLDFMDPMDICSLLGNALDNAIECTEKIEDSEKRLIHMLLAEQKKFVLFKVENYCEDMPQMVDGVPKTTKEKKDFHGYGIKSMKYVAEKYNGVMTFGIENHWAELKVLIPLPEHENAQNE